MRITGGIARGIPLKVPQKTTVRPATDFLREAIFSSLGPIVQDASFLDLFAGTGAYGLETLSRGACLGTFVERDRKTILTLKDNLAAVAKSLQCDPGACECISKDVLNFTPKNEQRFDLIFIDPPYEMSRDGIEPLLEKLPAWLTPTETARIILEIPGELPPPLISGLEPLRTLGKASANQPCAIIYGKTS
tara:strand:+ start:1130 stop:1702 length:573 start_codon:yes stop_codon:yes gene_type:complete